MGKRLRRLPSPSMGVAFIALLAALGGTAVALPGKNGVKADDIAKNSVNSADVKNSSLTRSDIKNSTLRGSDVGSNTLTGSDIAESSLGTVPSANTANSANTATNATNATNASSVGGFRVERLNFAQPGGGSGSILNDAGLQLNGACSAGNQLSVTADTSVDNALLHQSMVSLNTSNNTEDSRATGYIEDDNFDIANAPINLLTDTGLDPVGDEDFSDSATGTLTYAAPGGARVTVSWSSEELAGGGLGNATLRCFFTGTAFIAG